MQEEDTPEPEMVQEHEVAAELVVTSAQTDLDSIQMGSEQLQIAEAEAGLPQGEHQVATVTPPTHDATHAAASTATPNDESPLHAAITSPDAVAPLHAAVDSPTAVQSAVASLHAADPAACTCHRGAYYACSSRKCYACNRATYACGSRVSCYAYGSHVVSYACDSSDSYACGQAYAGGCDSS